MANKNEIAFFAKTNFRNQERVFGIKTDDRTRHMYIIGKTGMGKTNLLENLVVQDIRNGHGICYIDPHGDTAEKLLKAIPANRINDVIYLNPADQNFPLAFNVMESVDPDYRHLVASGLIGVFKKIWADSWGPRLEYILRNAILALLEYPGSTLLGVTRILVDKKFREKVVDKITDPVIRQFWVDEFPKWSDKVLQEVVSPIQNKVGQFLSSSLIRNIVGQTQSSFDLRDIMDNRKILILNLSKGRIGEDNSALLGAMMITKIQLAAMARVDIPEEDRNDFYLYVDEFQNFATESFANILSEARKYRLNLILANQYITQIDEKVRDAIFGNAGTIVSFRVGALDAEFLEKEFTPVFLQTDIVNLPKYHIYLKLMIDGIAGDAFSAVTLPPVYIADTEENEEKIIASSRERYASSKDEVEDKISRWAGVMPAAGFQTVNRAPQGQVIQNPNNVNFAQSQNQGASNFQKPQFSNQAPLQQFSRPTQTPQSTAQPQARAAVQNTQSPAPRQFQQAPQTSQPVQAQQAVAPAQYQEPSQPTQPVQSFQSNQRTQPISAAQGVQPVETQQTVQPQQFSEPVAPVSAPQPVSAPISQNVIQPQAQFEQAPYVQDDLGEYNQDEAPKPMFEAICDMCSEHILVPFQPDGKRPTFCKDCLKDFQRMTAKEKLLQEKKIQREQEERQPQAQYQQQIMQQSARQPMNQQPAGPQQQMFQPSQNQKTYQQPQRSSSLSQPQRNVQPHTTERKVEYKAYASTDKPMSLSQMQHIAPKKFKQERQRPNVNLDEVRSLINTVKQD